MTTQTETKYQQDDRVCINNPKADDNGRLGYVRALLPQHNGIVIYVVEVDGVAFRRTWKECELVLVEKWESEEARP